MSSLEYRAADLKAELDIGKVSCVRDEGDLDLQQFFAEIKNEDKENLFTD